MNKTQVAAVSVAGGSSILAGLSVTSEHVKGWLDIAGQIVTHPAALTLLLLLVAIGLCWLLMRMADQQRARDQQHAECEAKIGRLERVVLLVLRDDDRYVDVLRNWDEIKAGTADLDEILLGSVTERRRSGRRGGAERRHPDKPA